MPTTFTTQINNLDTEQLAHVLAGIVLCGNTDPEQFDTFMRERIPDWDDYTLDERTPIMLKIAILSLVDDTT